jgi:predicted nucleic acid-binding protein
MKLVVDASVAAKWRVVEALSTQALALLDSGNELIAPELFWAEVGNILWKKARAGDLTDTEAIKRFDALTGMGLRTVANASVARDAVELAPATGRTVYDAVYVALAMRESCRFVTADERLVLALTL